MRLPILKFGKMIVRSMFSKPATHMYPILKRDFQERTRGHIQIDIDSCIFCSICQKKCPADAILVSREEKSWTIQRMQCVQCNYCIEVCPKDCLVNKPEYTEPDVIKVVDRYEQPVLTRSSTASG